MRTASFQMEPELLSSHWDTGELPEETGSKEDVLCQGRESGVKEATMSREAGNPVRSLVHKKADHHQHNHTGFSLSSFTAVHLNR